jgi:signal transduction histidine kinase
LVVAEPRQADQAGQNGTQKPPAAHLGKGAWAYLALVVATGCAVAASSAATVDVQALQDIVLLELLVMAVLAKQWPITYASKRKIDASLGVYFLAALYRPDSAVLTALVSEAVGHALLIARRQRGLPALLFNTAQHVTGTGLAVAVLSLDAGPLSLVVAGAAMYLCSITLVGGMVALAGKRPLLAAWRDGLASCSIQAAGVLAVSGVTHYALHNPKLLPSLMIFPTAALWMVWRRQVAEADRRALEARLEAEREKVRVRQEFLGVAAHELRTPITTIKGYTYALRRQGLSGFADRERTLRQLEAMDQQCTHLAQLINQLLDLSRLEANKLKIAAAPTDLAALCEQVADDMALATGRAIVVKARRRPVLPIDAVRIEQVLVNLINNAVKFSPQDLPVYVHVAERDGGALIQVEDFGNGVPEQMGERIFERYQQAHGSEAVGGLGLGLYVSRQIVELHQGTIAVQNAPHGGAVFTVTLPGVTSIAAGAPVSSVSPATVTPSGTAEASQRAPEPIAVPRVPAVA